MEALNYLKQPRMQKDTMGNSLNPDHPCLRGPLNSAALETAHAQPDKACPSGRQSPTGS